MLRTIALAGTLAIACTAAHARAYIGTTVGGGAYGQGSVIEWDGHGHPTTLYSFCARNQCADGARQHSFHLLIIRNG